VELEIKSFGAKDDIEIQSLKALAFMKMERYSDATDVLEVFLNTTELDDFISPLYEHALRMKNEYSEIKKATVKRLTYDHSLEGQDKSFIFYLCGHEGVGISTFLTKLALLFKGVLPPRDCLQYTNEIQKDLFNNIQWIVNSKEYPLNMKGELPTSFSTKSFGYLLNLISTNNFDSLLKENPKIVEKLTPNYA
jgi:hypothetical protein